MFCSHWHLKMDAKWKFKKFVLMLLHLWCCYLVFVLIDIKDNVSDTTSESSSLDLDFFAPSTTQPSEGKPESRGLYEEDLLGLNIFSSSLEPQKLDSPKPQKTSDTKKVWQHGGVTIPLSSQESRAQLSPAAKSILDELEDLRFMSSSVLMFPLKS